MFKLITLTSGEMDAMERLGVCERMRLTERGKEGDDGN